jgi:outer membrane protein assembly factor BamE (lipoprotein component of BamABCDE complex)
MRKIHLLLVAAAAFAGCISIGRPFIQGKGLPAIELNKTTRDEIQKTYGDPALTGTEDGDETWTYIDLRASVLGVKRTEDLEVRFNKDGTVRSYNFNTDRPQAESGAAH